MQETAAAIKKMDKKSLTQLELELRQKLSTYQKAVNKSSQNDSPRKKEEQEKEEKISIQCLPNVKTLKEFKLLQVNLACVGI